MLYKQFRELKYKYSNFGVKAMLQQQKMQINQSIKIRTTADTEAGKHF